MHEPTRWVRMELSQSKFRGSVSNRGIQTHELQNATASVRSSHGCRRGSGLQTTTNVVYPAKGVRQLGGRGGPLRWGSSSPAAPVLSDCEAVGSPNHRLRNQSPTTHRVQKLWSWCTAVLYACAQPVPCCTSSAARVQSTHGDAMLCTRNLDALHRLLGSFFT